MLYLLGMNKDKIICNEILKKIENKLKEYSDNSISCEEKELLAEAEKIEEIVYKYLLPKKEYFEILKVTSKLEQSLNDFMNNNYVLDNNIISRERKLKLIERIRKLFTIVADFSLL